MTCRELVDFLGAYLDDELSADLRLCVDEHLGACPACSAYLETYRRTVRLAKDTACGSDEPVPPDVPEDLVKEVLSARRRK